MRSIYLLLFLSFITYGSSVKAQGSVGIKTNLFYGAYTYTPNLGLEIGLSRHTTLEISGGYNPWNLDSSGGMKKAVHFLVQPEFRYFFSNRFGGHFMGVHAIFSKYNIGGHNLPMFFGDDSKDFRFAGSAYGGGITYGYQFLLGKHWNLELSAGVGVMQLEYDKHDCINCGSKVGSEKKTYLGPTKAAVSIMYVFKSRRKH